MRLPWSRNAEGTVVFIHGFQDTAALWDGVKTRLRTQRWRLQAVNLRLAEVADPDRRGAILEGYRDQVLGVLERIDPTASGRVVVVGHSMGSQVGELIAVGCPDTVVGLALIAPIPLGGYALTPAQATQFDHTAHDRNPDSAARGRRALLSNDSRHVMRALVRATLATPTVTAEQQLRAWTTGHPLGDRPSVGAAPVLLVGGSDDTFSSPGLIRNAVAPRFTDVRAHQVTGAGHWPHVEQPAVVAQILSCFLSRLTARSAQPVPNAINTTEG